MQMVKKILLILVVVWIALVIFMPKAELYYTLEKSLAKKDIRLNEESIEEGLFSLHLKHVTLYVKGIALAQIKEIKFVTLLFYSNLSIQDIEVDSSLKEKVPVHTSMLNIRYTLLFPTVVSLDANGSFGVVEGKANLIGKKVHIDFTETKDMDMLKPWLQKSEKGWYYEGSF